jgi:hypothetical protein
MEKSASIKQDLKFKRRKQVRHLSSINFDNTKPKLLKAQDKKHLLPLIGTHQVATSPIDKLEIHLNSSMKNPLFRQSDEHFSKLNKIFEKKLDEKLKIFNKNDDLLILKAHLEVLEKIIKVDYFGSILEKIYSKILDFISTSSGKPDLLVDELSKDMELSHLKDQIKDLESCKKSIEQKLKKLSIENIDLLSKLDKLEEENLLLKDYKKSIKIIDGVPDTLPILKELRTKTTILDSLDRKNKDLLKKEKYLNILIKAVKERGLNPRDLVHSFNDRRSSSDSINLSRMSIGSEMSRLS